MSHTVEILSVGTELLLGNIVNLDAQILSQGLSALGLNVYWHTVVGDNPQRAREAVELARSRADIIITTGGLGPTCDDLTKNVLAEVFGKKLVYHQESLERIKDYARVTGRPLTENNFQQALVPEGSTVLVNDWGSAPGCAFEADGVHVIMLPGPPSECRPMFQHRVVPYLQALSEGVIASHTLKLFGIGESQMEAQLRDEMNAMSNPTLAPYAKEGEVELRITAKAATQEEAAAKVAISAADNVVTITLGFDVNMTGKVDVNDAQLVYDMYNGTYSDFTKVSVEKFLRADVNATKVVDHTDAVAIVNQFK